MCVKIIGEEKLFSLENAHKRWGRNNKKWSAHATSAKKKAMKVKKVVIYSLFQFKSQFQPSSELKSKEKWLYSNIQFQSILMLFGRNRYSLPINSSILLSPNRPVANFWNSIHFVQITYYYCSEGCNLNSFCTILNDIKLALILDYSGSHFSRIILTH